MLVQVKFCKNAFQIFEIPSEGQSTIFLNPKNLDNIYLRDSSMSKAVKNLESNLEKINLNRVYI